MSNLKLSYVASLVFLFFFSISFFTLELYMPHLRKWKSSKMLFQAKIYLDESINRTSGLIEDGIRKAKIASLLDPGNKDTFENYNLLLFRTKPSEALTNWSAQLERKDASVEERILLLERSTDILRDDELPSSERKKAGKIAFVQMGWLVKLNDWAGKPENALLVCELLAETGNQAQALRQTNLLLEQYPEHPRAIFLLTRLSVHLNDTSRLPRIGTSLAVLSAQRNEIGIDAIRHMTLLHLIYPLDPESLNKCIDLLRTNKYAKPIDFLRINALRFASSENEEEKNSIIKTCSELFDLEKGEGLLTFSHWLARLRAFPALLEYLPASKAAVDESLFKIRMNAHAHLNDVESIHREVKSATIIPTQWRLVVQARAFALTGNFKEASAILDRLHPVLGQDHRKVRTVCEYLEQSDDIPSLVHILEKLIDKPIHQRYALRKLMQHRAASASLPELLSWMSKLSTVEGNDPAFSETYLYFELLDPILPSPSVELSRLIEEAKTLRHKRDTLQTRIILALAHLRNHAPDQALVALGSPDDWRMWQGSRSAWAFICTQILRLNHDSEKAFVISETIDYKKMDRAERESLGKLFPDQFPSIE
jgi:hypothetical protein